MDLRNHGDGLLADLVPRANRLGVIIVQNPTHFDPKLKTHTMSAKAVIPVPV